MHMYTTLCGIKPQIIHHTHKQMSAPRKHYQNVTVVVRNMCTTQRKIVGNICKCNSIIFICSGKYRKIAAPNSCVFNLTNIVPKSRLFLTVISESQWKIVNLTVIFLWVYYSNLKKWHELSSFKANKQLNAFLCSF